LKTAAYGWLTHSRGLPAPQSGQYPADSGARWHEGSIYVASIEEVRDNFRRYGLVDDQAQFLKADTPASTLKEKAVLARLELTPAAPLDEQQR
jgi:O-methyltransferase